MERIDRQNYYLNMAETAGQRGTCIRKRYGAIIVNKDRIVSTGYVGAPHGRKNCCDLGECLREKLQSPSGERYELCRSVHAEANAIIQASKEEMDGAIMYLVGTDVKTGEYVKNANCCSMCKRMLINSGIKEVVIRDDKTHYRVIEVKDWIQNDESLENHRGY